MSEQGSFRPYLTLNHEALRDQPDINSPDLSAVPGYDVVWLGYSLPDALVLHDEGNTVHAYSKFKG